MTKVSRAWRLAAIATLAFSVAFLRVPQARADGFTLGDAANYAVIYQGTSGSLQITNLTINGNVGVAGTGQVQASGPGTINGSMNFAAANTGQSSIQNTAISGGVSYGVSAVQTDMNNLDTLSSTLGAESGASLAVSLGGSGGTQTINASAGTLTNGNEVFTISKFQFNNGATLIINGDGLGHNVVINFDSTAQFGGVIELTGGLTSDDVLFNVLGTNTLQLNNNGEAFLTGTFLDPNGTIQVTHTDLDGSVFGGGSSMQLASGDNITAPTAMPEGSSSFVTLLMVLLCLVGCSAFQEEQPFGRSNQFNNLS